MSACCEKKGDGLNGLEAVDAMIARLSCVDVECVKLSESFGRVLAAGIFADRDSPSCDVSAMDGYAFALADIVKGGRIRVGGEICIGEDPGRFTQGRAMKIFTGGPVPSGVDVVVKREDTLEGEGWVELKIDLPEIKGGMHIRRRGENGKAGEAVLEKGTLVTGAVAACLANFGHSDVLVYKRLRVGILTTGDELKKVDEPVADWEIRDSNTYSLMGLLSGLRWITFVGSEHAMDDLGETKVKIKAMLEGCDVLFVTGGVSMGDHDYVPQAVEGMGGEIIFHKLGIRPGKPLLGCVAEGGRKMIMGLPGNPVSALVTARRFGFMGMQKMAGFSDVNVCDGAVEVETCDKKTIGLTWFRQVKIVRKGNVELVENKGSGDVVGNGMSDGFIQVSAGEVACGRKMFYRWC